jgi:MFS transporter, PPP family, 3-phenylpropionic acid transporter
VSADRRPASDLPAGPQTAPVPAWALRLYLFLLFASVGLTEPFLNLHLRRLGLSGVEIGALAAIQPGIAAMAPFVWTAWADATGRARGLFVWNSWLAGLAFIPVVLARSPVLLAGTLTLFALLKSPLVPLANSLAFQSLGAGREASYGRIRLWGSMGYIVAAVGGGILADRVGAAAALGGVVFLLVGCGGVASGTMARGAPEPPAAVRAGVAALFRQPGFSSFLAATLLARFSAAPYNTFFTIQLDAMGISQAVAGQAWAVGVISEMAVMAAWPRLVGRARPDRLLTLAIAAHALRWWLTASLTSTGGLLAIQTLHGLTFGAFYLASVHLVEAMVPPELRATGQGLYAAGVFGFGGMAGNYLAGRLFDRIGLGTLYRLAAVFSVSATLLSLGFRQPSTVPS